MYESLLSLSDLWETKISRDVSQRQQSACEDLCSSVTIRWRNKLFLLPLCNIRNCAYFRNELRLLVTIMTQLTLQFKNASIKNRLLKVIELMNGVTVVEPTPKSGLGKAVPNKTTQKAMQEAQAGQTIKCSSFEEYLKIVQ